MNQLLRSQVAKLVACSLLLLATAGCGGAEKYRSDISNYREAQSAINTELAESVVRTNAAIREQHYATLEIVPETDDPRDNQVTNSSQLEEDVAGAKSPQEALSPNDERKLVEAITALNTFSKRLAQLSGLEDGQNVTSEDIKGLSELLTASSGTLEGFAHHNIIKNDLLKSDLEHVGQRLSVLSELFSTIATQMGRSKRKKAIKMGVRRGIPIIENLIPCLHKTLRTLRTIEMKAAVAHRRELLAEVDRVIAWQTVMGSDKTGLVDDIEAYLKLVKEKKKEEDAGSLARPELEELQKVTRRLEDRLTNIDRVLAGQVFLGYADRDALFDDINRLNAQILRLKADKTPDRLAVNLIKSTARLRNIADLGEQPSELTQAVKAYNNGVEITLTCGPLTEEKRKELLGE